MSIVRAKAGVACAVFIDGGFVTVSADLPFDSDDPVVKARPELFEVDSDNREPRKRATSVPVEDTSATPGRLRNR